MTGEPKPATASEYAFTIESTSAKDSDGRVIEYSYKSTKNVTTSNTADATFDGFVYYKPGTYTYTLSEVRTGRRPKKRPASPTIQRSIRLWSASNRTRTTVVSEITSVTCDGKKVENYLNDPVATITNIYEQTTIQFAGTKFLNGADIEDYEGKFHFQINQADENGDEISGFKSGNFDADATRQDQLSVHCHHGGWNILLQGNGKQYRHQRYP